LFSTAVRYFELHRTTRLSLTYQNPEESTLLSDVIRSNQKSSERIQSESEALQNTSEIRQNASEEASVFD